VKPQRNGEKDQGDHPSENVSHLFRSFSGSHVAKGSAGRRRIPCVWAQPPCRDRAAPPHLRNPTLEIRPRGGPQLPDRSARLNWIGSRTGSGDACTSGISPPRCEAPSGDRGPPGGSGGLLPLIDDPFDLCRDGGRTSARSGGVMLSDPVTAGSAGVGIVLARE